MAQPKKSDSVINKLKELLDSVEDKLTKQFNAKIEAESKKLLEQITISLDGLAIKVDQHNKMVMDLGLNMAEKKRPLLKKPKVDAAPGAVKAPPSAAKKSILINKMHYFKTMFRTDKDFRDKYSAKEEVQKAIDSYVAPAKATEDQKMKALADACWKAIKQTTIVGEVEKEYKDYKEKSQTPIKQEQFVEEPATPVHD